MMKVIYSVGNEANTSSRAVQVDASIGKQIGLKTCLQLPYDTRAAIDLPNQPHRPQGGREANNTTPMHGSARGRLPGLLRVDRDAVHSSQLSLGRIQVLSHLHSPITMHLFILQIFPDVDEEYLQILGRPAQGARVKRQAERLEAGAYILVDPSTCVVKDLSAAGPKRYETACT